MCAWYRWLGSTSRLRRSLLVESPSRWWTISPGSSGRPRNSPPGGGAVRDASARLPIPDLSVLFPFSHPVLLWGS